MASIVTELNSTFYILLAVVILASILTGSSLQWVASQGGINRKCSYNTIVTVAASSSLIQTVTCYVNALMHPVHNMAFMIFILVNWVFMTHSSVMLVSKKLSLTYINSDRVWKRLLLINVFMFPISLFTCVYWTVAYNVEGDTDVFQKINAVMEPIQITLWGIIEFCLSGMFIVQMWKFSWTQVERQAIFVLVLVAICDTMSVLTNVLIGDLPSTCVKGFVYALRIRLEIGVLNQMVEFVKNKRGSVTYGSSNRNSRSSRGSRSDNLEGPESSRLCTFGSKLRSSMRIFKHIDHTSVQDSDIIHPRPPSLDADDVFHSSLAFSSGQVSSSGESPQADRGSRGLHSSRFAVTDPTTISSARTEDGLTVDTELSSSSPPESDHDSPDPESGLPASSDDNIDSSFISTIAESEQEEDCDENARRKPPRKKKSRWDSEDDESRLPVSPFHPKPATRREWPGANAA